MASENEEEEGVEEPMTTEDVSDYLPLSVPETSHLHQTRPPP